MRFRDIGYSRKALQCFCLALVVLAFNGVASACYYSDHWQSSDNVYATSVVQASSPWNYIRATVELVSPDARDDYDDSGEGQGGQKSAVASLAINLVDGYYDYVAEFYESPYSPAEYQAGEPGTELVKYIQIVLTEWNGNFSARADGTATYRAQVYASVYCNTVATVEAAVGGPTGMVVSWDGVGNQQQHTFSGGETFNYEWPARTGQNNQVGGTATGSTSWIGNTGGCTQKGPDAGSGYSLTKNTTVP